MYYVYMVKNSRHQLYVGITENPNARVRAHNSKRGAKFTKSGPDFEVVFLEQHDSLAEARSREVQLKKWRREKKEMLINKYRDGLPTKQSL